MKCLNLSAFKILLTSGTLAFATFNSTQLLANTLPDNIDLEYNIKYGNQPLGYLKRSLTKSGDYYKGTSVAVPNLVAQLFNVEIEEHCEFKIDNGQYIPISFRSIRKGYKDHDNSATFNNNTVNLGNGQSLKVEGELYDQGCFAYAFAVMDLNSKVGKNINLHDGEKLRPFKLASITQEDLNIEESGNYNSIRVTLERTDKEGNYIDVWLDKKSKLPIKTVSSRTGKKSTTLELKGAL